jgi:hypothetical protein
VALNFRFWWSQPSGSSSYATWQKLQIVAIVSIILLIGVLYKNLARKAIDIIFSLTKNTKQAKFGQLEINIEKKLAEYSKSAVTQSVWMNVILSKLDPEHLGLLLTIQKDGKHTAIKASKSKLRDLRALGLLRHNNETMEASTEVWLTELGNEIATTLISKPLIIEENNTGENKNNG